MVDYVLQKKGTSNGAKRIVERSDIRVFLQAARAGQMAGASRTPALDHSAISLALLAISSRLPSP
jgi:hypothetical protein